MFLPLKFRGENETSSNYDSYSVITLCFVYGERENYNCPAGNALRCAKIRFGGGSLSLLTKATLQDKKLGTLPR